MGKRKTIAEMALAYRRTQRESEFLSDMHWRAGYLAGARSTRLSAAQRRVVEAAVKWRKAKVRDLTPPALALTNAVDDLEKLERAKGGRK